MKTPNLYLLWLKESYMLLISSKRALSVELFFLQPDCLWKRRFDRTDNYILGCTLSSVKF